MKLIKYLVEYVGISKETAQQIDDLCEYEELPKGHLLLGEGNNSKKVFFVEQGLVRMFYLKDGKDITHFFFYENMVYTSIENVFLEQPSPYSLELLEDSIIRTIDFPEIISYIDGYDNIRYFVMDIMISVIKRFSDRLYSIQFQSAKERYNYLCENYHNIIPRIPLGHIASYLGITPQTLSVIRSEK
jgi:CRP-like cAMP-binding protein